MARIEVIFAIDTDPTDMDNAFIMAITREEAVLKSQLGHYNPEYVIAHTVKRDQSLPSPIMEPDVQLEALLDEEDKLQHDKHAAEGLFMVECKHCR